MATGKTGYVDFTASSFSGSQTMRINWSETYDQSANTSSVTITSIQVKSNTYVGQSYYGNMVIKINGTTAITLTESNNQVYLNNFDTFGTVNFNGTTITGTVSNIAHNTDGSKTVAISIAANSYGNPVFWSSSPGSIVFSASSQNITLTTIPRNYTLSISAGTGSNITVTRNGTSLSNGATITYGDVLTISFAASTGYNLGTHTVNGTTFSSGGTHTVTGNVSVVSTATLKTFTLSISAGTGSSITVKRGSTTLSNGATITYGDVLTISFGTSTGYNLGTHTVNGTTFSSGGTHTVTGNVSVVSTASLKTFTLSISAGTGSSITVKRGSTTLSNGATITYGDVLTISFGVSTGYNLGTHTVNGSSFTSGNTHTVTGAVSVVSTASLKTFTLSINAGSNSNIVVKRSGTTLSNGATITYGDVLTINFSVAAGYVLGTHTVNGSTFASGNTHTVTGAVTVVSTATKNTFTLYISADTHSSITVTRNGTTLSNGATITYGDVLTISFGVSTGYSLSQATVNGNAFSSGGTITVTGNVSVVARSTANPYTLILNQGINTTIEVLRGTEALSNGATIAYDDVLTISFGVSTGYTLGAHTVNGVTFASGGTYTVTGNVTINTSAITSGQLTEPTNITPDEVYGTGSVDIEDGLTVSWQVNGNVAMTAYSITIYENTAASPQLYTTGQVSLSAPFWGHDYQGDLQRFTASTIPAAALTGAGLTNGDEYKFVITQWWGAASSITQAVPSVFATRSTPQLTVAYSRNDGTTYYFTGEYTQAQGVPLNWVRWTITEGSVNGDAVYDTGVISGTGELQVAFSGMIPGRTYYIHCQIETIDGVRIEASTSYIVQYDQSYVFSGNVTVCQQGEAGVKVIWELQDFAENYAIHRRRKGDSFSQKIADVNGFTTWVLDVSAASRSEYVYYVFPIGADGTIFAPGISQSITPDYWTWALIEAQEISESLYSVQNVYRFRMGKGGVSQGAISNNNSPSLLQNFTRYPLRQPSSANYRNGSLSALIGTISSGVSYSDSVQQMESILTLSNTQNALFLSDPKGHFLRVESSGPITYSVDIRSEIMPQTVTFPWVETDSTQMVTVLALSENVIGMEQISSGKLMTDGSITAAGPVTRDVTSDPIAVAGDYLILTVNVPGLEDGQSVRGAVVFYDANGAVISGDENYGDDGNGSYEHVFPVPSGAVTVRVGWSPYQGASVTVSFADAADSFEEDDLSFSVSTGDLVETRQAGYLPNLVFELINGHLTATGGSELQLWQEGGHLFSLDNN